MNDFETVCEYLPDYFQNRNVAYAKAALDRIEEKIERLQSDKYDLTAALETEHAEVEKLRTAYDDLWADANEAFNRLANRDPDEAYAALRRSLRKGGGE